MNPKSILALIALLLLNPSPAHAQKNIKIIGPISGHLTHNSANIWLYTPQTTELLIRYYPANSLDHQTAPFKIDHATKNFKLHLIGLKPNTPYKYLITSKNTKKTLATGAFKTPPPPNSPTQFKLAVTSCMKKGDGQQGWVALLKQHPDVHLMIGDSTYADTTDYPTIWQHHLIYRQVPEFAKVLAHVSTYAVWDDHDYGPNNSDGTSLGKANSLRAFKELFPNPKMGTQKTPGVFHTFSRGDVQFFMLDIRYHRSPDKAKNNAKKRMLGDGQYQWLKTELLKSKAKFKIIAMGSTLQASKADGWRIYSFARKRLFELITKHHISGVIFLSGDIHKSIIQTHRPKIKNAYPLTEVISSGITRSKEKSFATLAFDTTQEDPTVTIKIIHGNQKIIKKKILKLSELQVKINNNEN